jgi:hypothetical protein
MSTNLQTQLDESHTPAILQMTDPSSVHLSLDVTDSDSVKELIIRKEGRTRDEYALSALKIGILSLRHASGQMDVAAMQREGDRFLRELGQTLASSRTQLTDDLAGVLKEYFHPSSGRFQERVERLIRRDGDLEQVLRRQIGSDGSELAKTLAEHLGENSAIMRLLDPNESASLVRAIRQSAEEALESERSRILAQFSLDNKESALSRMVAELSDTNGRLTGDLTNKIDEAIREFSLDKDDSALSRLVRKVEAAQRTITNELSLDNEGSALNRMSSLLGNATDAINNNLSLDQEGSALGRLRREVVEILDRHEAQATTFQRDVTCALEAMKARREESLRSTTHGKEFQDVVFEFARREAERGGDLATCTGNMTGAIKHCKIGDATFELGPDCAAAGERFVIEAKEDASYDLNKARLEMESARKNRDASVGLFVFSRKTAPAGQDSFLRYGNDVFVIWDAEDLGNDTILKAAVSLAKGLCVRAAKARDAEAADFQAIDSALLAIEKEAKRLRDMTKWTDTIKSNSVKILEEARKMTAGIEQQIQTLREASAGLKGSVPQAA